MLKISILLGAALVVGCGPPPKVGPQPGPAIAKLNLSGKWYSDQFEGVKIVQNGRKVNGSYEGKGPEYKGTFRGTIEGDIIWLDWVQPGNPVAAVMPMRGKAWLRISKDGQKLDGTWGYDDSMEDGGKWTSEKSQYQ